MHLSECHTTTPAIHNLSLSTFVPRFPVFLSRTTRVLLQSSSHGPQLVTLLPPCLLSLPVSFLTLLLLPLLTPGVPSQQQKPSATSLLTGTSSSSRCGGWSFTTGLSVLSADWKPTEGVQLSLLHVHRSEQREARFTRALIGRSAGLSLEEVPPAV